MAAYDGVVLIAEDDEIVWHEAFGSADYSQSLPMTTNTRFRIASLSKQVTQAAIGRLVDDGKLTLRSRLSDFLPDFPNARRITIKHLLDHTAGIAHTNRLDWMDMSVAMTLDEIVDEMRRANEANEDVARVHSGDPSLYGAIAEQIRRLGELGIAYDITPGVPAYAAAAAALGRELTLPGVSQTVILTRTAMKASAMPEGEELATLAASGATLAIHLSVRNLRHVTETLAPIYGADCPAAVVYRASWPDQQVIRGTLADIRGKVRAAKITRTALVLVGRVLDAADFNDSRLYDPAHLHVLRPKRRA